MVLSHHYCRSINKIPHWFAETLLSRVDVMVSATVRQIILTPKVHCRPSYLCFHFRLQRWRVWCCFKYFLLEKGAVSFRKIKLRHFNLKKRNAALNHCACFLLYEIKSKSSRIIIEWTKLSNQNSRVCVGAESAEYTTRAKTIAMRRTK